MKALVIKQFIDKQNNNKLQKVGFIIDVNKQRFEQLYKLGFVEIFEEEIKNGKVDKFNGQVQQRETTDTNRG